MDFIEPYHSQLHQASHVANLNGKCSAPHTLLNHQTLKCSMNNTQSAEDSEDDNGDDHIVMEETPINTDMNLLKKCLFFNHPSTDTQRTVNKYLEDISQSSFTAWIAHIEKKIEDTYCQSKGPQKCNSTANLFLNQFGKSEEFHDESKKILHCKDLQKSHLCIGIQPLLPAQNGLFKHKTDDSSEHLSWNNIQLHQRKLGMGNSGMLQECVLGEWSIITLISSPETYSSQKKLQSHKNHIHS